MSNRLYNVSSNGIKMMKEYGPYVDNFSEHDRFSPRATFDSKVYKIAENHWFSKTF